MDMVLFSLDVTPWSLAVLVVGLVVGGVVGKLRRNVAGLFAVTSSVLALLSAMPRYGIENVVAWMAALACAGVALGNYISVELAKFEDKAYELMMQMEATRQMLLEMSATLMKERVRDER